VKSGDIVLLPGVEFMRTRTCAAAGAALACLALAGSAAASVSFIGYGTALPPGETTITDFATLAGETGSASLFTGSQGGVSAAPAYSASTFDIASYLSVLGGESATLTFQPSREISIYIGSLDSYNTLTFAGPGAASFTGGQLAAATTALDNGDQTASSSNGRFIFDFSAPVTSVTFSSTTNSFEVASVAGIGVPESAAWALMLVGIGGVGGALRSRRDAAIA
jgi:hypothetical protein